MPDIDLSQITPVTDVTVARLTSPAAYDELVPPPPLEAEMFHALALIPMVQVKDHVKDIAGGPGSPSCCRRPGRATSRKSSWTRRTTTCSPRGTGASIPAGHHQTSRPRY
jgi:hypothetical protein